VFLLHDVFSYGYDETAQIVGRTQDNCRQLARRARQHVSESRPRYEPSPAKRAQLADRFFAAVDEGDLDGLVTLLAADVGLYGDNGGMRPSWPRPVSGRDKVSRVLATVGRQIRAAGATVRQTEVNGQPGVLYEDGDGALIAVLTVDIADGQVQAVRTVLNRDKLRHLGPLADVAAVLSRVRRQAGQPARPGRPEPGQPGPAGP
jgi:RNA polymerase sigma-70 factor (ECF subfamily)